MDLDTTDPEVLERAGELGSGRLKGVGPSDDLHHEGVVVRADDGAGESAGRVKTDAHALSGPEHLQKLASTFVFIYETTEHVYH